MVKMPLKGVVGGRVLNGNNIVDHGQIMELCFWISVGTLYIWAPTCSNTYSVVMKLWNIFCYYAILAIDIIFHETFKKSK